MTSTESAGTAGYNNSALGVKLREAREITTTDAELVENIITSGALETAIQMGTYNTEEAAEVLGNRYQIRPHRGNQIRDLPPPHHQGTPLRTERYRDIREKTTKENAASQPPGKLRVKTSTSGKPGFLRAVNLYSCKYSHRAGNRRKPVELDDPQHEETMISPPNPDPLR